MYKEILLESVNKEGILLYLLKLITLEL